MARRLPRRGAGGRFLKGGGGKARRRSTKRRRRNPPAARAASSPRSNPPRRRRYRRNPSVSVKGIGRQLMQGAKDAVAVVLGKAGARAIPTLLKLPQSGPLGLGVQLATAVAEGFVATRFAGRDVGRFVMAGGLSAPLETFIVAQRVPFLAPALSPATAAQQVGAYRSPGIGSFALPPARPAFGVGAYASGVSPSGYEAAEYDH